MTENVLVIFTLVILASLQFQPINGNHYQGNNNGTHTYPDKIILYFNIFITIDEFI